MNDMKLVLTSIVCLVAALCGGCASFSKQKPGDVIETWEASNNNFKIRVTAYDEKGSYPAPGGAYYVFKSSLGSSDQWNYIMTFRHDDPVAIPRNQIRFVNEQIGYVFMGWLYAVTTDGGRTWSVWDASKNPTLTKTYNYNLIGEVSVAPNGTGKMVLKLAGNAQQELETKDYGQHWTGE